MNYEINPFQVLYVTDSADPKTFVQLFSKLPVDHAPALFVSGNVVLKGTQGAGKSMLLNLLKPEIRLAYAQVGVDFPVSERLRRFIGAGINLTRSGALDIGQLPLSKDSDDETVFPLFFADFLNYFIVRDLLSSLRFICEHPDACGDFVNGKALDVFAKKFASQDCWFGYLSQVTTFQSLNRAIDGRLSSYRKFHQNNAHMDEVISSTTTAIGEPIARAEECLKKAGVVPDDIPIFVRIDQLERLYRSDILRPTLGKQYRRIINKALSTRDSRISYRIGTRPYAWGDDLTIFGTDDQLEHLRDYRIIDLDEMLRRREDTKTWIFPEFAKDVFRRRLEHEKIDIRGKDPIQKVFGLSKRPKKAAGDYAGNSPAERILKLDDKWPDEWRSFLKSLYAADPLSAIWAAAWARQRGQSGRAGQRLREPPPTQSRPWNRTYWQKERGRQALMQIAARAPQRLKWSGKESILALSSGNIAIFVSICSEIWDDFNRYERRKPQEERKNPIQDQIDHNVQAVGIDKASKYWYDKIVEQPMGDDRQRFIDVLGGFIRSKLLDDEVMSYPGHNGFSIANDELKAFPSVKRFLNDADDYGDLYGTPHTTKRKDRRQRTKWYLRPILSPFFQLPEAHQKEPYYTIVDEVVSWLEEADVFLEDFDYSAWRKRYRPRKKNKPGRIPLFEGLDEVRSE